MRISDWSSDVCSSDLQLGVWTGDRWTRPLNVAPQRFPMLRSNYNCAHHEVGMSVPEFCKRQYGNVDAPIEWLSKKRGSPSIVSRYQNIILARNCRNRRNVDNIECHRSRAFQVYHPGRRPEACR